MTMLVTDGALGDRQPVGDRRLTTAVDFIAALDAAMVDEMFDLYAAYYDGTSRELFARDLADKDHVVTLRTAAGTLAGFSTLALVDFVAAGRPAVAIFSGDTIIDQPYWGTQALAFTWIRFAGSIKARAPDQPLFWFLIVKGHRTYRYLSAFSIDFVPHWDAATPPDAQAIMDSLARRRFAERYDPRRGVVSFPRSQGHLKPEWAFVSPEEAARPDVAFFLRRNPGYVHGDEMVCLTELAPENLRPLARRVFEQGMRWRMREA
jgi:hypothetical protein